MVNKYEYAAGISDRYGNWGWQGYVVASSVAEATKMLVKWKKRNGYVGAAKIASHLKNETTAAKGVY